MIDLDTASLWWAGKEMTRGKKLRDFVGKNEKTKIVCKLQKVSTCVKATGILCFMIICKYMSAMHHAVNLNSVINEIAHVSKKMRWSLSL